MAIVILVSGIRQSNKYGACRAVLAVVLYGCHDFRQPGAEGGHRSDLRRGTLGLDSPTALPKGRVSLRVE